MAERKSSAALMVRVNETDTFPRLIGEKVLQSMHHSEW